MRSSMFALLSLALAANTFAADPLFSQQWGMANQGQKIFRAEGEIRNQEIVGTPGVDIKWPGVEALATLGQGREVIVAVIDSGLDLGHPELKDRVFSGRDFLDGASMTDDTGHGTHVAGIIAANVNGRGIQGVTPFGVKILPLKVLNKDTTGFVYKGKVITDIIADAIAYAIEGKASVINMSLGWPQVVNTPRIIKALDTAAAQGIVIVAAAGNNNKDVPTWPCAHPAVICVGAVDNQGKLTEFSNHGGKVDLVAPGEWIVSTIPRALESRTLRIQGYEAKNGSSQASPFVAAAAALLKLQNPAITGEEVKARLYASASKMPKDSDQRFVRFGALNIAGALAQKNLTIASVSVKNLVTIDVSPEGGFDFTLPIEILGATTSTPDVSLLGLDADVSVEGKNVRIRGVIENLRADSEIPVTFTTTLDSVTTRTSMTLSLARKLETKDLLNVAIKGIPGNAMVSIQGARKSARVGQVSVEDKASSDFHGYIQAKNGEKIRVVTIRANSDSTTSESTEVILEGHHQLLSVFEKDVNFDGKNDLVFYGMNTKRDHLILTFTDLDGTPLFGKNSRWEMPITTFEGLPLKDGERADFAWLRLKTFMGDVAVPYYQKAWLLPKEDNVQDLLDFEPAGMANRFYYWEPTQDGERVLARPRVVDSVSFNQKLQKAMNTSPWEEADVERILPQTALERANGTVRHVVSAGENFFRRFAVLKLKAPNDYSLKAHADTDVFQIGNNPLTLRSLDNFAVSENSFQMALLDRSSARVKPFVEGEALPAWTLKTSGWNNPFFEVVATFEGDDRRVLFFESRYHVYVYDQVGAGKPEARRLPINRDSSFPGVNFSETLQSVLVKDQGVNHPAVAVNSTLIYGDRLYAMLSTEEAFNRPIALSVKIPANCVPLKSQVLTVTSGLSAFTMLCQQPSGDVNLSFFPLQID